MTRRAETPWDAGPLEIPQVTTGPGTAMESFLKVARSSRWKIRKGGHAEHLPNQTLYKMSDQKNPTNANQTSRPEQKNTTQKPQDSNRPGGDAARTTAAKPEDKNEKQQPGRSTKPDVKAGH